MTNNGRKTRVSVKTLSQISGGKGKASKKQASSVDMCTQRLGWRMQWIIHTRVGNDVARCSRVVPAKDPTATSVCTGWGGWAYDGCGWAGQRAGAGLIDFGGLLGEEQGREGDAVGLWVWVATAIETRWKTFHPLFSSPQTGMTTSPRYARVTSRRGRTMVAVCTSDGGRCQADSSVEVFRSAVQG